LNMKCDILVILKVCFQMQLAPLHRVLYQDRGAIVPLTDEVRAFLLANPLVDSGGYPVGLCRLNQVDP
jgi:hypothetical protein